MKLSNITFAAYLAGTTMAKKEETTPSALRQRSVEVEVEDEELSIADIVNGDVLPKSFKPGYLVSLGSINKKATWPKVFAHNCGGSLISPSLVLTAAHCFDATDGGWDPLEYVDFNLYDQLQRAGTINVLLGDTSKNGANIQVHPGYKGPPSYDNDFALIVLDEPINKIDPIKINGDENMPSSDDKIWNAGWGANDTAAEIYPNLPSYIETTYSADCTGGDGYANPITANMLCTVGELVDEDKAMNSTYNREAFCSGDSGGPLIKNTNQGPILLGVVSFSDVCGDPDLPDVYARVSAAHDWINCWMEKTEPKKRRSKACKEMFERRE